MTNSGDLDPVLTLIEAAAILRISESTAKKLAARGTLPGVLPKVGRQWRVSRPVLEAFVHGTADGTPPSDNNGEHRATTS